MRQFTSGELEFFSAVAKGQGIGLMRTRHWSGHGNGEKSKAETPLQARKSPRKISWRKTNTI